MKKRLFSLIHEGRLSCWEDKALVQGHTGCRESYSLNWHKPCSKLLYCIYNGLDGFEEEIPGNKRCGLLMQYWDSFFLLKILVFSKNTYFALSIFPFSKTLAYTSIAARNKEHVGAGLGSLCCKMEYEATEE